MIVAILCITIVECFAIHNGFNGVVLTVALTSIAGIGGFSYARNKWKPIEEEKKWDQLSKLKSE